MSFDLDGYVDVAERIAIFYDKFPDGRLTRVGEPEIRDVGSKVFVIYTAAAYRTSDDPVPAMGTAWEPFPGPTQFTRDSELMNAETAAWGRAIVACGIGTKKIASRQEVRARNGEPVSAVISGERAAHIGASIQEASNAGVLDAAALAEMFGRAGAFPERFGKEAVAALTEVQAGVVEAELVGLLGRAAA